jgi:glycosyltransferase involved in cell wall biosynthesis
MKICFVCDTRLPAKKYGGTERVVEWLVMEFVKMGHDIVLVALTGTSIPEVTCIAADSHQEALLAIPCDVDIVHFHAWPPKSDFALPWLYTLHGNAQDISLLPKNTVFISRNHRERHQGKVFVYNGVNPAEFVFREQKKDYLLFLSLIRRKDKGAARAMKLARRYGVQTVFAGGTRMDLLKSGGFMESFHPMLHFVGKVSGSAKAEYFANAKALLFPINWEEPFGLVLIESLMSGTPVIATPRGAVPELITSDVGALFTDDDLFGDALERALGCSPKVCRDWAVTHFSSSVCAANYFTLYERILSGEHVFA